MTPDDLIAEHNKLDDFVTAETKRFTEHLKPVKERMEEIKNQLLALLNAQKLDKIAGDHGTAYISTLLQPTLSDREVYLDYCLENWDEAGNELLIVGKPQIKALHAYLDTHNGEPPPGVAVSWFRRVNINRS